MEYFLGVDGGASSTTGAVVTGDGAIAGIGLAGPSNHILAPGGRERAREAITGVLTSALTAAGLAPLRGPAAFTFRAAQFGMTGIVPGGEPARAFTEVARECVRADLVLVDHDATIARAGALACRPGVVVIAGTGSVALGEDADGHTARAGGWGYIFGDEGSAFAIGLGGVRAALHARDGTGPATMLIDRIGTAWGYRLEEIPIAFYEGRIERSQIAALAPVVSTAAGEGDGVARRLLEDAAGALAALAAAVIGKLRWPDGAYGVNDMLARGEVRGRSQDAPAPVAPVGGMFTQGSPLLRLFREAVAARTPGGVVVPPRLAPAAGAALLAMRAAHVPPTPGRLAMLAATWELRGAGAARTP